METTTVDTDWGPWEVPNDVLAGWNENGWPSEGTIYHWFNHGIGCNCGNPPE